MYVMHLTFNIAFSIFLSGKLKQVPFSRDMLSKKEEFYKEEENLLHCVRWILVHLHPISYTHHQIWHYIYFI